MKSTRTSYTLYDPAEEGVGVSGDFRTILDCVDTEAEASAVARRARQEGRHVRIVRVEVSEEEIYDSRNG